MPPLFFILHVQSVRVGGFGGVHRKLNNAREQCTALQTWVGGEEGGEGDFH